jgi:hypothetical protein
MQLHDKLFTLQSMKEEIIKQNVKLRDLVKIKCIPISSALISTDKISKINLNPNTLEEGEEIIMDIEL